MHYHTFSPFGLNLVITLSLVNLSFWTTCSWKSQEQSFPGQYKEKRTENYTSEKRQKLHFKIMYPGRGWRGSFVFSVQTESKVAQISFNENFQFLRKILIGFKVLFWFGSAK